MGNCISNTGGFEPPGAAAVKEYTKARDIAVDPVRHQLEKLKAETAELKRRESVPANNLAPPARPRGPKCSVCFKHCTTTPNPWQATQTARLVAEMSDSDSETKIAEVAVDGGPLALRRPTLFGIQLASCKHVFCGACLAQAIYLSLNLTFDPELYGTVLKDQTPAVVGRRPEFPICCPECRGKPGPQPEISDHQALLVLGPGRNMDAWNHQRFLSGLNLIYCPHKGCDEQFDADDVAPAPSGINHAASLVQCPRCRGSLCKACKCIWHDKLTCEQYQALPANERAPEDVAFANLAQQEKWRRCPKCSAMVELKALRLQVSLRWKVRWIAKPHLFLSSHITCVCKHHFCYQCGADFAHTKGKYRCVRGCKVWEEDNLLERR
ncbi:RBR-type E3 ubiquitin transferase [Mycena kentingensis (nom. inval.)]|nr:RBR-type E3 ubiquitin transferase [Mycena kentingensis (nom. inval.)]